jgi:simple sugar transport system substrate-binding protein
MRVIGSFLNGRFGLRSVSIALALVLSACSGGGEAPSAPASAGGGAGSGRGGERYVLVSHAPDSDSWWNTIKNSVVDAGEDFGVAVDYRNPPNGDLADMARLIEQSAARNYAAVATSIADFSVLSKATSRVTGKGIALVTINSGTREQSKQLDAIMHIGQPEYDAGKAAGERAKAAGVTSFLCVNHYATNLASVERCKGFADALGADLRASMLDTGVDPTVVSSKVGAYLRNNPKTGAVLALGPNSAEPTLQVLKQMGLAGKIFFATFDLSPTIVQGIEDGELNFAIDQQPYLQGYLAIAALKIAHDEATRDPAVIVARLRAHPKIQARLKQYALEPVYTADGVSSGPGFVTRERLDVIKKYAGQYR